MESSRGIQQLMEAEQSATKIVQEMREAKVERMKQAKTEAAGVVETYKAEKLAEFRAKESGSSLSTENAALEKKTEAEIAAMRVTFEKNKQDVIQMILGHVTNVKLEY
eukprot:CAMPEP_0172583832 /NCGR_PEP_ID=MMETSP1068-20121228/3374_1 /TAXON_ID=35684 /ORGANISM="Pseudopedinella elastica, Strain CCMP716" /LENGTH=107 /DNA_ID=CAMNT_0013377761 /DNA_START=72 /DNA_END=395 /DNA_ORIENTATION=+